MLVLTAYPGRSIAITHKTTGFTAELTTLTRVGSCHRVALVTAGLDASLDSLIFMAHEGAEFSISSQGQSIRIIALGSCKRSLRLGLDDGAHHFTVLRDDAKNPHPAEGAKNVA